MAKHPQGRHPPRSPPDSTKAHPHHPPHPDPETERTRQAVLEGLRRDHPEWGEKEFQEVLAEMEAHGW